MPLRNRSKVGETAKGLGIWLTLLSRTVIMLLKRIQVLSGFLNSFVERWRAFQLISPLTSVIAWLCCIPGACPLLVITGVAHEHFMSTAFCAQHLTVLFAVHCGNGLNEQGAFSQCRHKDWESIEGQFHLVHSLSLEFSAWTWTFQLQVQCSFCWIGTKKSSIVFVVWGWKCGKLWAHLRVFSLY